MLILQQSSTKGLSKAGKREDALTLENSRETGPKNDIPALCQKKIDNGALLLKLIPQKIFKKATW